MKVLLIDVNCKHSSTGKIVYDLYTELNNSGHEAAVCYGRGPLIKEKNIYKFGIDLETYFHAGMTRLTGLTGFFSILSTLRLINYIDKFKPDVVHIHELHAYFVNIGRLMNYLKVKNIRTVWTFHCEFMYTGKCGHAHDCEKFKKECHNCPQLREYPKSIFFDFTRYMFIRKKKYFEEFNNLTIVTPSEWLAKRVKESFLSNKRCVIIKNGIDTDIFNYIDPEKLINDYKLHNKKVVISVAPNLMSDLKGGQWVMKIASRLQDSNDIVFIMIGVDNPDNRDIKNVIQLDRINNQNKLAMFYSLADLFLICSKRENYPTTCLESLACGTPILGFKTGGTAETVSEEFGKFFEYGDIDSIINEILNYFSKQEAKKPTLSECRDYSIKYNSKATMISRYFSLYKLD